MPVSFPVSDIKRTLDAMSWVKINTLHWHVVDSQSFPLVIPGFDQLAEKGAYNAKSVYTPEDVKGLVAYAAAVCSCPIFLEMILIYANNSVALTSLARSTLRDIHLSSQSHSQTTLHAPRLLLGLNSPTVRFGAYFYDTI